MKESVVVDVCLKENAANGDLLSLVRDSIEEWQDVAGFKLKTSRFGPDKIKVFEGTNKDGGYDEGVRQYSNGKKVDGPIILIYVKER